MIILSAYMTQDNLPCPQIYNLSHICRVPLAMSGNILRFQRLQYRHLWGPKEGMCSTTGSFFSQHLSCFHFSGYHESWKELFNPYSPEIARKPRPTCVAFI